MKNIIRFNANEENKRGLELTQWKDNEFVTRSTDDKGNPYQGDYHSYRQTDRGVALKGAVVSFIRRLVKEVGFDREDRVNLYNNIHSEGAYRRLYCYTMEDSDGLAKHSILSEHYQWSSQTSKKEQEESLQEVDKVVRTLLIKALQYHESNMTTEDLNSAIDEVSLELFDHGATEYTFYSEYYKANETLYIKAIEVDGFHGCGDYE